MSKEPMIAISADPGDPDDFAVTDAALARAHMGRRIRLLRRSLGLTQDQFASRYGIPLANIRQYEIGRTLPPPAVQSYIKVIEAEPVRAAEALRVA